MMRSNSTSKICGGEPEHRPRIVKVEEILRETPTVKSIVFRDDRCSRARPGQFAMVWLPGVDEIPFSLLGSDDKREARIVVKAVGKATRALCSINQGDMIGVRGPYGNWFLHRKNRRYLFVAGGTGLVPILQFLQEFSGRAYGTLVAGFKTRAEMLLFDPARMHVDSLGVKLVVATEDGSFGIEGLASEIAGKFLAKRTFNEVLTCGPEAMMKTVLEMVTARGIETQACLERFMKCGIGICGSCVIGPYRVCKDGPVFTNNMLNTLREFGILKRDIAGRRVPL